MVDYLAVYALSQLVLGSVAAQIGTARTYELVVAVVELSREVSNAVGL